MDANREKVEREGGGALEIAAWAPMRSMIERVVGGHEAGKTRGAHRRRCLTLAVQGGRLWPSYRRCWSAGAM